MQKFEKYQQKTTLRLKNTVFNLGVNYLQQDLIKTVVSSNSNLMQSIIHSNTSIFWLSDIFWNFRYILHLLSKVSRFLFVFFAATVVYVSENTYIKKIYICINF
jgi:predicted metallopeptidase